MRAFEGAPEIRLLKTFGHNNTINLSENSNKNNGNSLFMLSFLTCFRLLMLSTVFRVIFLCLDIKKYTYKIELFQSNFIGAFQSA